MHLHTGIFLCIPVQAFGPDEGEMLQKTCLLEEVFDDVLCSTAENSQICMFRQIQQGRSVLVIQMDCQRTSNALNHSLVSMLQQACIAMMESPACQLALHVLADKAVSTQTEPQVVVLSHCKQQCLFAVIGVDGVEGSIEIEDNQCILVHGQSVTGRQKKRKGISPFPDRTQKCQSFTVLP
ncbi:hypothetical protein SDC9_97914 [bioreactor metagenome]|uniref:Uncharacterized protein n=1 Tax=bioreactor metagenome TaxID=1076179 RepID=A0A645ADR0_9ZZZZ